MPINLHAAFKNWGREIYAYVYLRVNKMEVAEDIVQDVFAKAWRSRGTFDEKKSSLKSWLFTITRNHLADFYKKNAFMTTVVLEEDIESEEDLSSEFEDKALLKLVFEKLRLLNEKDQDLIILRYKLDYKVKDIAEIMGLSLTDAKVSLHRAVKKLIEFCAEDL